jgi:hypothetical protein
MAFPWSPGQVLTASALNDEFGSKLPYSFGTATPSTTESGFLWYDSNSTPAAPKFWTGSAFQAIGGGGKILQVVRATDSTQRSTTSGSFVDASISVTITPQKSDSAILLIWSSYQTVNTDLGCMQITDNSNNSIAGAQSAFFGVNALTGTFSFASLFGWSTPATTSAITYKGRFRSSGGDTVLLRNNDTTGQLFAIEVAA